MRTFKFYDFNNNMTENNINTAPETTSQVKNESKVECVKPKAFCGITYELGQKIFALILATLLASIGGGVYIKKIVTDRDIEFARMRHGILCETQSGKSK